MITKQQLRQIENWLYANARSIEIAKWNLIFNKGTSENLVAEMLKYQNPDGGFGNGLESDILTPESSAICSAEAIFMSKDFVLDLSMDWTKKLLAWIENTVLDIPPFWEAVPKSVEDYPHAPWYGYSPKTELTPEPEFTPNPCATIASALIYGTDSQRALGEKITGRCVDYLLQDEAYDWMHNTYCLQPLFLGLLDINSPFITSEVIAAINRRVLSGTCVDQSKWTEYMAQPLDFVNSPNSYWHDLLAKEIPSNLDYWENTLTSDGYWPQNWNYGIDTEFSRTATKNWIGYFAVKRVKILKAFGRIENS